MSFLLKEDLKTTIRTYRLDQILDQDDTIFEQAASTAESLVNDHLYQHYETATIFSASGEERNKSVMQWLKYITLYLVYDRIPDELVPERVVKNYTETIDYLIKISEGKVAVNLPRKVTAQGEIKTKFRWGSVPARSH